MSRVRADRFEAAYILTIIEQCDYPMTVKQLCGRCDTNGKRKKPKVTGDFTGAPLRELLELLDQLAENVNIISRRGLSFKNLVANQEDGKLPTHWIQLGDEDLFYHSASAYESFLKAHTELLEAEAENGNGNGNGDDKADETRSDIIKVGMIM